MPEGQLVDRDGRHYPIDSRRWCAPDGGPLQVSELPGLTRDQIDDDAPGHWRYAAALPLELAPVSLAEGCTPLVPVEVDGLRLAAKLEWCNPTLSFKDRGTSVLVSLLAAQGVREVVEDSSGNAGASLAAYCAAAGIEATILVSEATAPAKVLQAEAHQANVVRVPGDRAALAAEALRRASEVSYASHNWHPFFLQGTKLLAYEIWEDLDFRGPDAVVVPAGAGSLVLGLAAGFGELLRSGQITQLPRLLVTQPANCAPLARAFEAGWTEVRDEQWAPTMAAGTAITHPVRDREVLAAVRTSGGAIVAVTEDELAEAWRQLARRGLLCEPTSASVAAGLGRLRQAEVLRPGEVTVMVLTGSGAKDPDTVRRILAAH